MKKSEFLMNLALALLAGIFVGIGLETKNYPLVALGLVFGFLTVIFAVGEVENVAKENNKMLKKIHETLGIKEEEKK